jgi:hypothetical protein
MNLDIELNSNSIPLQPLYQKEACDETLFAVDELNEE